MIDLHYSATPNGHKITMCLEELGIEYRKIPVALSKGEQFKPELLAISPNNKIPAIVDHAPTGGGAPLTLFESGAILIYLAEKTGRLLPAQPTQRYEALAWLFWQVSGLGPMAGQMRNARNMSLVKASSVGNELRVLITLRRLVSIDSIALVV